MNNEISQGSIDEGNKGISTFKDENTGLVTIKGLPYTHNPKLDMKISRREYEESGVDAMNERTMRKLAVKKKKSNPVNSHSFQKGYSSKAIGSCRKR